MQPDGRESSRREAPGSALRALATDSPGTSKSYYSFSAHSPTIGSPPAAAGTPNKRPPVRRVLTLGPELRGEPKQEVAREGWQGQGVWQPGNPQAQLSSGLPPGCAFSSSPQMQAQARFFHRQHHRFSQPDGSDPALNSVSGSPFAYLTAFSSQHTVQQQQQQQQFCSPEGMGPLPMASPWHSQPLLMQQQQQQQQEQTQAGWLLSETLPAAQQGSSQHALLSCRMPEGLPDAAAAAGKGGARCTELSTEGVAVGLRMATGEECIGQRCKAQLDGAATATSASAGGHQGASTSKALPFPTEEQASIAAHYQSYESLRTQLQQRLPQGASAMECDRLLMPPHGSAHGVPGATGHPSLLEAAAAGASCALQKQQGQQEQQQQQEGTEDRHYRDRVRYLGRVLMKRAASMRLGQKQQQEEARRGSTGGGRQQQQQQQQHPGAPSALPATQPSPPQVISYPLRPSFQGLSCPVDSLQAPALDYASLMGPVAIASDHDRPAYHAALAALNNGLLPPDGAGSRGGHGPPHHGIVPFMPLSAPIEVKPTGLAAAERDMMASLGPAVTRQLTISTAIMQRGSRLDEGRSSLPTPTKVAKLGAHHHPHPLHHANPQHHPDHHRPDHPSHPHAHHAHPPAPAGPQSAASGTDGAEAAGEPHGAASSSGDASLGVPRSAAGEADGSGEGASMAGPVSEGQCSATGSTADGGEAPATPAMEAAPGAAAAAGVAASAAATLARVDRGRLAQSQARSLSQRHSTPPGDGFGVAGDGRQLQPLASLPGPGRQGWTGLAAARARRRSADAVGLPSRGGSYSPQQLQQQGPPLLLLPLKRGWEQRTPSTTLAPAPLSPTTSMTAAQHGNAGVGGEEVAMPMDGSCRGARAPAADLRPPHPAQLDVPPAPAHEGSAFAAAIAAEGTRAATSEGSPPAPLPLLIPPEASQTQRGDACDATTAAAEGSGCTAHWHLLQQLQPLDPEPHPEPHALVACQGLGSHGAHPGPSEHPPAAVSAAAHAAHAGMADMAAMMEGSHMVAHSQPCLGGLVGGAGSADVHRVGAASLFYDLDHPSEPGRRASLSCQPTLPASASHASGSASHPASEGPAAMSAMGRLSSSVGTGVEDLEQAGLGLPSSSKVVGLAGVQQLVEQSAAAVSVLVHSHTQHSHHQNEQHTGHAGHSSKSLLNRLLHAVKLGKKKHQTHQDS